MTKLEEYEEALRKIEKNPKDRIGTLGKVGILASGAAGGGAIVAAIGGGSIWGLTTAASWIGVTLVSAAALPVVLAGAGAGLAIAGGLAYFLNSGSKCDLITTQNMQILKKKIEEERNKLKNSNDEDKISKLSGIYADLIHLNLITEDVAKELLQNIIDNKIDFDLVYETALELLNSVENIKEEDIKISEELKLITEKLKSYNIDTKVFYKVAILLTYVINIDDNVNREELLVCHKYFEENYKLTQKEFATLFVNLPTIESIKIFIEQLLKIISKDEWNEIKDIMNKIIFADNIIHEKEKELLFLINKN